MPKKHAPDVILNVIRGGYRFSERIMFNKEVAALQKKTPRRGGAPKRDRPCGRSRGLCRQMRVMSRSLVSGRKMSATTKLIAATTIGYHRPE
jgi:hypothetical protein